MFKLKVGDVCHIKKRIPGLSWKCGFYRVKLIRPYFPICDVTKPSENVYRFEKIKKDGTPHRCKIEQKQEPWDTKSSIAFCNGCYECYC